MKTSLLGLQRFVSDPFSAIQIDSINSCLNSVISLPLKRTVFQRVSLKNMLRATHFGCAIREVFLSYRHVAAPVGYDKRLSLALNILPRRLFLLLLFSSFATDT